MEKSPEQIESDASLHAAIQQMVNLNWNGGLLTDWVIVMAVTSFTDDGQPMTGVGLRSNVEAAPYRTIGLLDQAADRLRGYSNGKND